MSDQKASPGLDPATFIFERELNAPRELVFKAFTEREHLVQWWGPKGFAMLHAKLDLRPGGMFHYCMRSPQGDLMWGRFVFREISAPERLSYVTSFSDERGEIVRAPFAIDFPLEVLSILTFTEQEGKTKLTMHGIPINATAEEMSAFLAMHKSMQMGWGGSFQQLEAHLANVSGK